MLRHFVGHLFCVKDSDAVAGCKACERARKSVFCAESREALSEADSAGWRARGCGADLRRTAKGRTGAGSGYSWNKPVLSGGEDRAGRSAGLFILQNHRASYYDAGKSGCVVHSYPGNSGRTVYPGQGSDDKRGNPDSFHCKAAACGRCCGL